MICSRVTASRAPAAPLRGLTPLDPPTHSQTIGRYPEQEAPLRTGACAAEAMQVSDQMHDGRRPFDSAPIGGHLSVVSETPPASRGDMRMPVIMPY